MENNRFHQSQKLISPLSQSKFQIEKEKIKAQYIGLSKENSNKESKSVLRNRN